MKKVLSLLFTLALALVLLPFAVNAETVASGAVEINETTFPDANFRSYITSQDYGADSLLTADELSGITSLDVAYMDISNLTGIEYFTELNSLNCLFNQLTSLDLSKNTALTYLNCAYNQLTNLDVSKHTALMQLYCYNNQLTKLDVSRNTALTELSLYDNQLSELNVSNNISLACLWCHGNQLEELDVSKNPALQILWCFENRLTSLDVSKNLTLSELSCHSNQLKSLNVSNNTALVELSCHSNQLKTLDVSKNSALQVLACSDNQLTNLLIGTHTALRYLDCSHNQLTSIDVSKCLTLQQLFCQDNQLTSINVSNNSYLTDLSCGNNQLVSLDLYNNIVLTNLSCDGNSRTVAAVHNNFDLGSLEADGFDLSKASTWKGGTISGTILTAASDEVTYAYDLGNGANHTFILLVDGFCEHDWVDATCTAPKTCKACSETEGTALGHQMSEWKVTLEPTPTADGEMKRACQRQGCDYVETDIVPKPTMDSLTTPVAKTSNDTVTGKVKVTWAKVTNALEYEISRATSMSGTYTALATTAETAFIDTSAEPGTLYYYKVKAINSVTGATSDYSAIVSRTCDLAQPVVTASNVASSGKVRLTWEKVEGVTEYKVYRATSKSGEYKLMKTTTGTSYTNTSAKTGSTYYYRVKAIHSNSVANSVYSEIVSRTCDLPQPVVKASNVASSGKVKLTWAKIDGAKEYKVYRATTKDGEYKLMKTTTGTSYTNTSAEAGTTYYYKVKAIYSKSSANSAYSEVVTRTCDLARPVVTIKLKNGDPRLTWEKVAGATEYQVYRATSKDGEYKLMKTTTGTSYTNTSAKSGKTYYYKVKAIHSNSVANSAYSSVDSIKAK